MKKNSNLFLVLAAVSAGFLLLYASGCIVIARILEIPLKKGSEPSMQASSRLPQAIVILTGPSDWSRAMARVTHAAELHRRTDIPVMICGNGAHVFGQVLQGKHDIRPKWIEADSATTFDNARQCSPMLKQDKIFRIFLVTDKYHMWRARTVFEKSALSVMPAPSSDLYDLPLTFSDFLPSEEGRQRVRLALHELIGVLWYRIRL